MFFWFVGLSLLIVWQVFRSPALDYRMVVLGALIPLGELPLGHPWVLHTLFAAVLVMTVIMLATRSHRVLRRRLLGIPIGMFMHLVLDGVWADTHVFWWPFFGSSFAGTDLPELGRGLWAVPMELVGIGALYVAWRAFGLDAPGARGEFFRTGRIDRGLVP